MERFPHELDPRPMLAAVTANLRGLAESVRGGKAVGPLVAVPESFPEPLAGLYRDATASTSGHLEAATSEYEVPEASQDQVRALAVVPIRGIPLIARRHGVAQPVPRIAEVAIRANVATAPGRARRTVGSGEVRVAGRGRAPDPPRPAGSGRRCHS